MILRAIAMPLFALMTLFASSERVWACAACYGKSDSSLAEGMNWAIFSLLVVVAAVLGGIASFFVYLAKRSAAVTDAPSHAAADGTKKI